MAYIAIVIGICSLYLGLVIYMAARQIVDVLREVRNAIKDTAHPVGKPGGKYARHKNVAELAQQHDQLLAALEQLVSDFEGCYADADPAMINARAAIAAVKGDAPC